ncbi:MAG: helix-turn-helix domain-containing protein [Candidatus Competibacteraceae bacterium]|nr:helix-turn-helix domain-containing protein [Candidatus Competibacteraceae bacterium]
MEFQKYVIILVKILRRFYYVNARGHYRFQRQSGNEKSISSQVLLGFKTRDICRLLGVSDSFVSKWKIIYEKEGPAALRLKYKGGKGFLTEDERYEIIYHLRNLPHCTVEELKDYIERHYGVVYQSRQSYYLITIC